MDQSVWFVETQYGNDWRWYRIGHSYSRRIDAREQRDYLKGIFPGRPFRVKQYKRVEE